MRRAALLISVLGATLSAQQSFALPDGLKVLCFEDHSLPFIQGELRVSLPPPAEDGEAWMRPFAFRMMAEGGSGGRGAAAFAQAADAIGLSLRFTQGATEASWSFAARAQDQETAMALLADRAARPAFDPLTLEPAREQAWTELSASGSLARAQYRFARSLSALPLPTERDLGAVDGARLSAWHRRLFRPDRATLVLWGDLDLAQARQLAMLTFGAWTAQAVGTPAPSTAPAEAGPFFAALPGEAPVVSIGLIADGADPAERRFLQPWIEARLRAAGLTVSAAEGGALAISATAPLGTPAESLRARIAGALDMLPVGFSAQDLDALRLQSERASALSGLHPLQRVASAGRAAAPADLDTAKRALARWTATGNRRLFASGDPGSLEGLQAAPAPTPKR